MILCVGVAGSGKSMLLRSLKDRSAALFEGYVPEVVDPDEPPPPPGPAPLLASIATIGTDFVKISKPSDKRNSPPEEVEIRELGGAVAPLWGSFIDTGSTKAVLFVVDASAPEKLGTSTVHLVELLSNLKLESAPVMVVFSKTDMACSRPLQEMKNIMRLDQIILQSRQQIVDTSFNFCNNENLDQVFDWCMQQQDAPPPQEDLGDEF